MHCNIHAYFQGLGGEGISELNWFSMLFTLLADNIVILSTQELADWKLDFKYAMGRSYPCGAKRDALDGCGRGCVPSFVT